MLATEHDHDTEQGFATLVTGIISDAQKLAAQQVALFHEELKHDIEERKNAAIPFVVGGVIALLASIFICLTAAHALVFVWPELPLFAAYGIVAIFLSAVGGVLILVGKSKFDSLHPIAEKSVKALKETVQWTTKT